MLEAQQWTLMEDAMRVCCVCGNEFQIAEMATPTSRYCKPHWSEYCRARYARKRLEPGFLEEQARKRREWLAAHPDNRKPKEPREKKPHYKYVEKPRLSPNKRCSKCGETKPRSEFYQSPRGDWRAACNGCHIIDQGARHQLKKDDEEFKERARLRSRKWDREHPNAQRERNAADPEKRAAIVRLSRLGVGRKQYDAAWEKQGGQCPICDVDLIKIGGGRSESAAHTDHDHETKAFRGILSRLCNLGLGLFKDNPWRMLRGLRYLAEHGRILEPDVEGIPIVLPY